MFSHSEQSISTRKSALNYFFQKDRFSYTKHILDIEKNHIIDYFNYLNHSKKISLRTKKLKWTIFKNFVQFCNEYYEDLIEKPVIFPKILLKWKNIHPEAESNKDIIATESELEEILDYFEIRNKRNYLIFKILVDTGMRVGELTNIDYDKVNCKRRTIETNGKTGKKIYYTTKTLSNELVYFIENRKEIRINSKALFISQQLKRISKRYIQNLVKDCLIDLGIKKQITPHTFRRTINTCRKKLGCIQEDRKILLSQAINDVNFESYVKLQYQDFIELYDKWYPYKS